MPKRININPDDESPEARVLRMLNIVDALPPGHLPNDDTPLREVLPGAWPTLGDLRGLAAFVQRHGRFK